MTKVLIAMAPYLSGILTAGLAFFTYHESKRKTQHDELHDLYDDVKTERDELKAENSQLRKELNDERSKPSNDSKTK